MTDYSQHKVPDLKKILQERGLVISGNKADLISRLQEDDKKVGGVTTTAGEDEIDWDEDDTKPTTEPAAAAIAAGGQGPVTNPPAVPNQKVDIDPSTTTDLTIKGGEEAPKAADGAVAESGATTTETPIVSAEPEAPKQDFSIGISQTDAEIEAEKRAARAKRFGITIDDEEKKLADRAKKFGLESKEAVVKGLDSALPEGRLKRGREERNQGGRNAKRQTPDRRVEGKNTRGQAANKPVVAAVKKASSRVTDDPGEKAKAEARAKRFAAAS